MTSLENLKTLVSLPGVSGREHAVRDAVINEIKGYADDWRVDGMGNLIVTKKGERRPKTKLMLSAHMDEVGFIVTHITKEGFLKFAAVGGIDRRVVPGRQVFVGESAVPGVIGIKPVHLVKGDDREKSIPMDELCIDIGADSREEAQEAVSLGDEVAFDTAADFSRGTIKAKAIDDRAGCAVLVSLIQSDLPYDMTFAFVVQEEIGLRGSRCAAFSVEPDACIVVEATTAADIPGVEEHKQVCRVGKGAVLSFMDKSTIYDKEYYDLLRRLAEEKGIPCQIKEAVAGGNDAGAIHITRGGIRTIAVSVPCRYLHSPMGLISASDFEAVEALVRAGAAAIAGLEK